MNPNPNNTHERKSATFIGLIFIMVFCSGNLFGISPTDSLKLLIKKNSENPERLSLLMAQLAKQFRTEHNDSCYQVALNGIKLAEQCGFNEGIIKNSYQLGRYLVSIDSLESSKRYLLRARGLIQTSTDPEDQMSIFITLGYIYDLQASFANSLDAYFKGLEMAESAGMKEWQQFFANNIAVIYNGVEQYQKSVDFYYKVIDYFGKNGDSADYANTLVNLGISFTNLEIFDSAMFYYNRALPIQNRLKNYYGLINLYSGLGSLQFSRKKFDEALKMYLIAEKMTDSLGKDYSGSVNYLRISINTKKAKTFLELKQYRQAEECLRMVISQARHSAFIYDETQAFLGLSKVFEATGRTDSALAYARLYQVHYDSLQKVQDNQRMGVLEFEFKYKKEKETLLLEKQKEEARKNRKDLENLVFIISILALVALLLMIILLQRSRSRRLALEQINLRLEKENLRKDIELKNRELTTKSMSLAEKDELLTDVTNQLKDIVETDSKEGDAQLRKLIHGLQRSDTKNFWDEFNAHFKEVHVDFYTRLSTDFPQITPNELKLCAFLKLNLSTKQIAQITRKSEHSIKIARYRLRQKIGLEREENLSIFLSKY